MDPNDLEKMFQVIDSLEPVNPRTQKTISTFKTQNTKSTGVSENESVPFSRKLRKPSLPISLAAAAKSSLDVRLNPAFEKPGRSGSIDPRKSLFQNDRCRSNSNLQQFSLFHANSRSLQKINQEINFLEIHDEENTEHFPRYADEDYVYDKVPFPKLTEESNIDTVEMETSLAESKRDTITSLCVESILPHGILRRKSSELINMNELRLSNWSENACHNRSVENKTNQYSILQSAPQSARNSAMNPLLQDKQSSIDSGVDQTNSINLQSFLSNEVANSSESFSDMSESNLNSFLEKELSFFNNESPVSFTWMNPPAICSEKVDKHQKYEEGFPQKNIPTIQSEEEQNMFFRMISNELSLNSFTTKEIIKFYTRNGTFSSQIIDKFQTAISVCAMLKAKFGIADETFCEIVEVLSKESLERPLLDHENVLEVFYSWHNESGLNRFIFQANPGMHKIFVEPSFFADEMKCDFEITDTLWIRAVNSKWIRATCSIVDNNVYYSLKQGSKDQKDLNLLVNLKKSNFFFCSDHKRIKKEYKSPTTELIIFKENKLDHKIQDNAYLAATNKFQKQRWMEAIKVAKHSFTQLKNNYLESQMCFPTGFRSQSNSAATIGEPFHNSEPCSM